MHGRRERDIRKCLLRICRKIFLLILNRLQINRLSRRLAVFHGKHGEPVAAELLALLARLAITLRRRLHQFGGVWRQGLEPYVRLLQPLRCGLHLDRANIFGRLHHQHAKPSEGVHLVALRRIVAVGAAIGDAHDFARALHLEMNQIPVGVRTGAALGIRDAHRDVAQVRAIRRDFGPVRNQCDLGRFAGGGNRGRAHLLAVFVAHRF